MEQRDYPLYEIAIQMVRETSCTISLTRVSTNTAMICKSLFRSLEACISPAFRGPQCFAISKEGVEGKRLLGVK